MVEVKVGDRPFEKALRTFKRQCERSGIIHEIRRRKYYEKPSDRRKKKIKAAMKRIRRQMQEE